MSTGGITDLEAGPGGAAGPGTDPFRPLAVRARYPAPRAWVHHDRQRGWIKRMAPVLLAHRWTIALALTGAVVMFSLQIAVPRVAMEAIDAALIFRTQPLAPFVVALVLLAVGRFVAGFTFRYSLQRASMYIEYDLRTQIFEHLTRLSFGFYDRVQSGQLISRANSDIRAVQMFLAFAPTTAITIVTFFAAFGIMLTIHVPLAVVAVSTLPLVYFAGLSMRSKLFPVSWVVQARQADIATLVEENVTGVRVVKSFSAEAHQVGLLHRAASRLRWAATRQIDIRARFAPLMQNLPRVGLALVLLYGGWLVIEGEVTVGTLVAFNAYVLMLQAPFTMLGFLMLMSQRARASAERIFEILDERPDVAEKPGAFDIEDVAGDVQLRDVTFAYGDGPAILQGLSLHLRPGETVAMVGRTGCGKSTVARLIPRFYDVTGGAVLVDGVDVRDVTLRSLRHHIGLVLDEPFLFSESIRDNITFGRPDATDEEVEAAARAAGAEDFILALPDGYDTVIGERGYTLSGGQRQRIAIARTLLVNPPILILDDATSAVDVQREQEIHDALKRLMAGRTTLIIAHRLSTVALADRVVLLEEGRILGDGTHEELLRTVPSYATILARAEEDWLAAHQPNGDGDDAGGPPEADGPGGTDPGWRRPGGNGGLGPLGGMPGIPDLPMGGGG